MDPLPDRYTSPPDPAAPGLRLKLLGRMAAEDMGGGSVLPRTRKSCALLGILALAAPRPVSRDLITGLLWSRREREQARGSLRQAVYELQASLGKARLHTDRNHLALRVGDAWIDAVALLHATPDDPDALDLLRAPLMEDMAGLDPALDRWLDTERRRMLQAASGVAEAHLAAQTDAPGIISAATRLLAIDPVHEPAWRAIIGAHLVRGDRGAALACYQRCAASLAERGLAVATETETLAASIRASPIPAPVAPARPAPRPSPRPAARAENGLRLGVMPFRPLDPRSPDELSVGLAEEITTALSRFRWVTLVSSNSLAVLAEEPREESARWQALDLDLLLEGTIQRGGGKVRITARLLDLRGAGQVIWTRRFDRDGTDILTLQDEIAAETVAQIDPELLLAEGRRLATRPARDATAYELLLQAIPAVYRLDQDTFRSAGEKLAAAAALDPDFAPVQAWWAYWHVFLVGQGWAKDPANAMARAGELAERAVSLDPSDARALTIAGHVRAFLHQRVEDAVHLHDRALSLNPNLPLAWAFSGMARSYAGQHEEAIRRIQFAGRLSPFDPHGFFFDMALMIPHLMRREFETVVDLGRRATALNPGLSSTQKGYLSALGHLGWQAEQDEVRERLLRLEPGFRLSAALARSPLRLEADRALYVAGLRLAGLPD